MKRFYVDIKELSSYYSLLNAFQKASSGKKGKKRDVVEYEKNLRENIMSLSERLLSGIWEPDSGRTFKIRSEGKLRNIHAVGIEDRIVHHAINQHAFCYLRKMFIKRTFGNIKKRGTLSASKQVRRDIRSGYEYVLQLDMKEYYHSINKRILKRMIAERIKGDKTLKLIYKIIDSYNSDLEKGISIGSLLSQDLGNFYLTPFDVFCHSTLNIKYYTRYVDDIVMFFQSKEEIAERLPLMTDFLKKYDIQIGSIDVYPISKRKVDFCAYQVDKGGARLRKRIAKNFIRKLDKMEKQALSIKYEEACVNSYMGFLKHCKSTNFIKQQRNEHRKIFERLDRYAEKRRREKAETASVVAGKDRIQAVLQSS